MYFVIIVLETGVPDNVESLPSSVPYPPTEWSLSSVLTIGLGIMLLTSLVVTLLRSYSTYLQADVLLTGSDPCMAA